MPFSSINNISDVIDFDTNNIWHPYSSCPNTKNNLIVSSTKGSLITLKNGNILVDGMSSWWSAIHGYNHPYIMNKMQQQINTMPHIMFGGLTHEPAIELAHKLINLTPINLNKVFFADSGSVAMEVAIKMALQYWISCGKSKKNRLLSVRNSYHGDTFATMAISDPENGMHHLFTPTLNKHYFADAPIMGFELEDKEKNLPDIASLKQHLENHHNNIAAVTIEPIVQGAGGMRFYRPNYLKQLRKLCDTYKVLLILDEIATGFGRTGKLFACEWAGISPDIMCLGKALTGGNISLATTLCTEKISEQINKKDPGILMHGPTFMANPLACATANASIELLLKEPWQKNIHKIQSIFQTELLLLKELKGIKDVRVLGAIGVIELEQDNLGSLIQDEAVKQGIWLRPFGRLIYTMPSFNIPEQHLYTLTYGIKNSIYQVLKNL